MTRTLCLSMLCASMLVSAAFAADRSATLNFIEIKGIRSTAVTHIATLTGLLEQSIPAEVASSTSLTEVWNRQTRTIEELRDVLRSLAGRLDGLLKDGAISPTESQTATQLISALAKAPETEARRIGLDCTGDKFAAAICGRNRIATDINWWILTECPND